MRIVQTLATITLASLPLYIVRCSYFSWCTSPIPFTLLEALIILSFIAWSLWKLTEYNKDEKTFSRLFQSLRSGLFWPLVFFIAVSSISVFISADTRAAAGVWKAFFIEPAMLFLIIFDLSFHKKSIKWLFPPILFSGFWVSVLAIWQFFTKIDPFAPSSIVLNRVTGVYDNPNALALYLGPLFLLGLGILFQIFKVQKSAKENLVTKLFLVFTLSLYLIAIFLSRSRGGEVAIIVSILFFFSIWFYSEAGFSFKKVIKLGFFFLVGAILISSALLFLNIDKFAPAKRAKDRNSLTARLCIWQSTKNILADNPLLGVGLSGFPKTYPSYKTCEPHSYQYPHNIFLNFWTEIGLAGLASFLWVVYKYWQILFKFIRSFVAAGLLSIVIYIFVHGLVDVSYFKNDLAAVFWVFLAIATWYQQMGKESSLQQ